MKDFSSLYDNSKVPEILTQDRTISKTECEFVYRHMVTHKPSVMFEVGVNYGCSTRAFYEMSKWAGLEMDLHAWDIVDMVRYIDKDKFALHIEDITGEEVKSFDKYDPDLVFLDAHPYDITKNIMELCLKRRINFMTHDVAFRVFEASRNRTNGFTNRNILKGVAWELYLLGALINTKLWRDDHYEDDNLKVECIRDHCGLAIVTFK